MQKDRYRDRIVEIDFEFNESLKSLPYCQSFSLVLVTNGFAECVLNGSTAKITAPAVLCLSDNDNIDIIHSENLAAQTFIFPLNFFGAAENETENIPAGVSVFHRSENNTGIFSLDKEAYSKIREWFFILGAEVFAQSDSLWVCRIKKYLIQILGMLDNLYREKKREPVNLALDYIHSNYFKKISLDELCRRAHTNRVSLNKAFKERYNCTAVEYLNNYRLNMAEKILTYTRMNLADIAHSTGFEYDTYFIRRFTKWKGLSPTKFRKIAHRNILGNAEITL